MESDLLTAQQAAEFLLVHPITLARWRTANKGPAWIEVEGQFRYRRADIENYLATNKRNGSADANG